MILKDFKILAILIFAGFFAISCSKKPVELQFSVIDSTYNVDGIAYNADYCKMEVLENPLDKGSKVIDIPVIRIKTNSKDPGAPIFILNDGPGLSNFAKIMPTWLAANHDVIIVGYRGVDGSVNLNIPELNKLSLNPNFLSNDNLKLVGKSLENGFKKLEDSLDIDLNQYNIVNIAYDVESARQAFQYQKLNLFAIGFGARIAQVYSSISPNSVFRIMLERPKSRYSISSEPKLIESILSFYDEESYKVNNNIGFSDNIKKVLDKLPQTFENHVFDKDKIIYATYKSLETSKGAALINEAFQSAGKGDYAGLIYLEELYENIYPTFNLGDYALKYLTLEYNEKENYSNKLSYNSEFALGSPLNKFIYGGIQNTDLKIAVLDTNISNPTNLVGECLIIITNLDLNSNYELAEFELKPKYSGAYSIILSDYAPQDLYQHNLVAYSNLISDFLYIGNYKNYNAETKLINLVPEKTLKQLALERIQ